MSVRNSISLDLGHEISTCVRILGPLTRTSCFKLIELLTLSRGPPSAPSSRPWFGLVLAFVPLANRRRLLQSMQCQRSSSTYHILLICSLIQHTFQKVSPLSLSALRRASVRYSLVSRIPEWAPDDVVLILHTDIGSPVGRPPFKVLPYGGVSEGRGAWEDSNDTASDELDEDFVPRVSHRVQSPIAFCSLLGPSRLACP
jgi:hypothetical protein